MILRFEHDVGIYGQWVAPRHHERIDIDLLDLRTGHAQIPQIYQDVRHGTFVKGPFPSKTMQQKPASDSIHEPQRAGPVQGGHGEYDVRINLRQDAAQAEHDTGAELIVPEKSGN